MSDSDAQAWLRLLFEQVNEHLRATDAKTVDLAVAYIGVVAITVSIISASEASKGQSLATASATKALAFGVLVILGACVVYVELAYRTWKNHYREVLEEQFREVKATLDPKKVPAFLGRQGVRLLPADNSSSSSPPR